MSRPRRLLLSALLVAACPVPAGAGNDAKSTPAGACEPYAPDTTAAELQYSPHGVYNPGTATEKVFCPLPRDSDRPYADGELNVIVSYRVLGGAAARVVCTLWVGSLSVDEGPVYSQTVTGPYALGGGREDLYLDDAVQASSLAVVPVSLICAIPPKTSLGAIYQNETNVTNEP
jgi:hypothetical protein